MIYNDMSSNSCRFELVKIQKNQKRIEKGSDFVRFWERPSNHPITCSTFLTTMPNRRINASSVAKPMCGNITKFGAPNNGLS